MESQFPNLFSPIEIGNRSIKNRICCSAHADSLSVDGMPGEAVVKYYEQKAQGGAGFIMCFGSASVHPSSPAKDWNGVELFEDRVIPYLQTFSQTMHRYEVPCVAQITHRGRRGRSIDTFEPLYGPSDIPEPNHRERPHKIEAQTLKEFAQAYAAAAWRLKEGGFDGCEIMASHGHLIDQFWSLNANSREDQFGGSLQNRLRFGIEVLETVRERVGSDFIIGIRISGDDFTDGGLDHTTCQEIAATLDELNILDYFNVIGGTAETYMGEAAAVPNMSFPLALYTPLSASIRSAVKAPVIATGRVNDPTIAEKILENGQADLCIMNRALIADPFLPTKAREGRLEDIRQCMGYNHGCIDRIYTGQGVMCVQNAIIGRETTWQEEVRASQNKKVLVVGGGAAGLECARVAQLAGHQVTLLEKEDSLGGQTLIANKAPAREDFDGACRYSSQQCKKLGVDIRLKTLASKELILGENPEVVVIATGAKALVPDRPGIKDFAYSAWEVLSGAQIEGDRVLVIDEQYGHQGPSVAEFLLDQGKEVEMATSEATIASFMGTTTIAPILQRLFSKGMKLHNYMQLDYIEGTEAFFKHVWGEQEEVLGPYDAFVYAYGGQAVDHLYHELKDEDFEIKLIGDGFAPRTLQHAIYEGHKVAREI